MTEYRKGVVEMTSPFLLFLKNENVGRLTMEQTAQRFYCLPCNRLSVSEFLNGRFPHYVFFPKSVRRETGSFQRFKNINSVFHRHYTTSHMILYHIIYTASSVYLHKNIHRCLCILPIDYTPPMVYNKTIGNRTGRKLTTDRR